MLTAAFAFLGLAVLFGTALAILHLRAPSAADAPLPILCRPIVPWPVAALHGVIGLAGLAGLMLALQGPPHGMAQGTAAFGMIAAVLIALAALFGGGILAMHRKKRRAGALIGIHATLAVTGFVVLAAYLLA